MGSLYEINNAYSEALIRADIEANENDGCIDDATAEMLDILEMDREEKIDNTALYIKNLKSESAMIKAEVDKLNARKKAVDKNADRISEWLKFNLHGEKRTSGNYKISYRKSTAVEVLNLELLQDEYRTIKTTVAANKTAIKKAIKAGEEVTGALLIEKSNMEVK